MNRLLIFFVLMTCVAVASDLEGQDVSFPPVVRDWTEASESARTLRGHVVKVNPTNVVISIEGSDSNKIVRKSQLCKADQTYLELAPLIASDAKQFDELQATFDALKLGQFPKAEDIKQTYQKYPKSPFGSLLMGVVTVATNPDYNEAEPYFERAYKSIALRNNLVHNLYPTTFVTCCNNYAIVQWRLGGSASPIKLLCDATRFPANASILKHNASIFATENARRGDKYKIPKKNEPMLKQVNEANFLPPAKSLEKGTLHFSVNVEPPPTLEELEQIIANESLHGADANDDRLQLPAFVELLESKNCPYEPWCMACSGRGAFRCAGRCARGVVSVPIQVQDAVRIDGQRLFSTRFVDKPCDQCNGKGVGDLCRECDGTGRRK